jgi:hypothetical protein
LVSLGPLVLVLAAGQSVPPPAPAGAEPAVSWEQARSLAQKLEKLEERQGGTGGKQAPPAVVVTEGELNSYLNLSLGTRMPAGLADVRVRLDSDRVAARAMVDLEQVRARMSDAGRWNPLSYLTGRVPLEMKGRYRHGQEGFGSLEVEEIWLATLPVPVSLLEQVVSSARRGERAFDIQAPFRLPYSAKRLRVQKGQARLEF